MATAAVWGPGGEKTWIQLSDNMTAQHLRDEAVVKLPSVQGHSADDVLVVWKGKTLEKSTPLPKCSFLPDDAFHLVLRVRGG